MSGFAHFSGFGYRYPDRQEAALLEVSLELPWGLTVVEGPSGGGKSTLLRTLNGLVPHFHGGSAWGRAKILGHDLRGTRPRTLAREVALVFQEPESQFVAATVRQEVAFGPQNLGLSRGEIALRVEEALADLEVVHLLQRQVASLSGGERQRVALAGALAMRPRVLVLDEPGSQLDPQGVAALRRVVERLLRQGVAVVLAQHRRGRLGLPPALRLRLSGGVAGPGDAPQPRQETLPARRRQSPGATAWELNGATVGHALPLLSEVHLGLHRGEVLGIVGANGSGKTTLLRTAAGLLPPLSGSRHSAGGRSAYLPQEPGAILHQPTVRREVAQTIRWQRLGLDPDSALREFSVAQLQDQDPRDLSTGQRLRVALAAVLVGRPESVFLDEPTRGADSVARGALVHAIGGLAQAGSAVLLASSDPEFVLQVADRILEIRQGRLVQCDLEAA